MSEDGKNESAPIESAPTDGPTPVAVREPSGLKRLAFWLVLLALLLLATLLVSETAMRLCFQEEDVTAGYWGHGAFVAAPEVGYRHAPGYTGRAYRRGVFAVPVTISAEGLRQSNVAAQQAFPRRLLILGDSYAFGLGVLEEEGFAARLQSELNARGIGVINGAQAGYCVAQEAALGRELIVRFRPDTVLLTAFVSNDAEGDFIADYASSDVVDGLRLLKDRWLPIAPLDWLRTHSYLGLWLGSRQNRERYIRLHGQFMALARSEPTTALRPMLTALEAFAHDCEAQHTQLAVLLVPPKKGFGPFQRLLAQRLDAWRVPYLDLKAAGLGPADTFVGDGHWSARGHARVAVLLEPFLAKLDARSSVGGAPAAVAAGRPEAQ